ncbi:flavin-containing monooxygenase [Rhodococcus koreensis]|jgi:cyclohexanone monooxygenase|uniref:flavin-containing monooxygenase n=1 Tax=Rhodococcus koreensis TaxID=99653 RepID=UPI00197D725D|nr:NAD(P)/FAD-dependent oxidoreductase [Rhodococcus koreensis]QSE84536.1 NAD(P)/FAD-dependent oxidoreductase [Rhodococcus koreensis]
MTLLDTSTSPTNHYAPKAFDAVIVGAGFSGMYMLHRLRGMGLTVRVYERGADVGGTWYWNRYPGARCDIESVDYSYSFSTELEQEWRWSERFATQPEILRYANHVADRFGLRTDVEFDTQVLSAVFDEHDETWRITTDSEEEVTATYFVLATGCLSVGNVPAIPGIDAFSGPTYHTGAWPHGGVDFTGQHVAVIGTGSSGIQSIPLIAEQASRTTVFQRTPNFSLPARNRLLDDDFVRDVKANYPDRRRVARYNSGGVFRIDNTENAIDVPGDRRRARYELLWEEGGLNFANAYSDLKTNLESNETAADFIREKIRAIVSDSAVAAALTPTSYPFATKRPCVDTGYYATFNRDDVELVDIRTDPIDTITERGVRTATTEFEVDAIVFATGFDAMTGAINNIGVVGRGGEVLRQTWAAGPRSYLGVACAGFPNMFTIATAGSPSVMSNMMTSIEQHVEWISDLVERSIADGVGMIEPTREAQDGWVDHLRELADDTLFPMAASWYMGANIPGKPRVFLPYVGGVGTYRELCDSVATEGYRGFSRVRQSVAH